MVVSVGIHTIVTGDFYYQWVLGLNISAWENDINNSSCFTGIPWLKSVA